MKNIWAYVFGFLIIIGAIFGAYYIGTQNVKNGSNNNYYNNVIDNTDKVISVTPGDDEQYDDAINFNLKSVSTKYGIGNVVAENNNYANFTGLLDGFWFTEHAMSSFLTIEKYASENGQSEFFYLKLSTKIGSFSNESLNEVYDGSVVFGFELKTNGQLNLKYTYASYGDQGFVDTKMKMGMYVPVSIRVPYILADDLTSVSALLSEDGYVKDALTWHIVTSNSEKIYFKDSVIQSITIIMKGLMSQYNGKPSYVDMTRFDWTNFLVVDTEEPYDYLLSNLEYRNGCSDATYRDLFVGVNGSGDWCYWTLFNHDQSIYNIPILDIVC